MGVQIKDILEFDEIELSSISNKKIAIDSFNMLYQFLASIRQADGSSLTDSKGNVTSHLKGLFNRCVYFKKNGIKAIFVFDGIAPKLKEKERENRAAKKMEADVKYREALEFGMADDARKYAQGINKLEAHMVEDAKELIRLFGFPIIVAPSEGEAESSYLVKNGTVWAAASQDFDSLLFGANLLIRNLSIGTKRKIPGTSLYKDIPIEFYNLQKNLEKLEISHDDLIVLAILCGTDFNVGGIKGIGPKKALKLVKEYKGNYGELFKSVDWDSYFEYDWKEVFCVFKDMPVTENTSIEFGSLKREEIIEFLSKRDFDKESTIRSLNGIKEVKSLTSFFG